jgi:hypothetical protein
MTANTTHPARPATTERGIAYATTAAPLIGAALAPILNTDAAIAVDLGYLSAATVLTANIMDALPDTITHNLPAGDILRAHRLPLFLSSLTTGTALAMGTLMGPAGTDALIAGIAHIASAPVPGIVSLAWWATVGLVPYQLRRVLRAPRRARRAHHNTVPVPAKPHLPPDVVEIVHQWATHISNPDTGTHRYQDLTVTHYSPGIGWKGIITARAGQSVTVRAENVSSVYRRDPAWINITPGTHTGESHITVHLTAPPELDPATLKGAWKKWVAKPGGIMAGTYLDDVQTDPNTGGEVAWVIAGEDLNCLKTPDRAELAGALRTNTLLCSYNPVPGDPRRGEIRLMKRNPLQDGVPFPGTDVLKISDGGYVQIGRHVSGFPARIQFVDPKLGAKHLFVAGVTGSGKGGLIQIVALADHVNGHAIIYSDPKGSSNPDVETMACFSGLGEDGCMGPLRVAYALMNWRIEESARAKMKNFVATPERPWVRVILDEAHVPLSELAHYRKEAGIIVEALAAKARSMGIILTIVNQAVNAEKVGGSTALRMNVIQGGSLVMLRSDSGQQHLVTTGFEGVDPGQIPASWDVKRPLVYDEKIAMQDPESTFGLGYTLGPGGAAEMMRDFILESAAPYIDTEAIAYPADWPDWDRRHEIAATSILGDDDEDGINQTTLFTGIDLTPKKPASAAEKILDVLQDLADPAGLETNYTHKDTIGQLAGVEGSTLPNTLSDLVKAGKVHRQTDENGKEIRGMYGLGNAPVTDPEDDDTPQ